MDSTNISEAYKKKLMKYYLQCLISEASKILLYAIFFLRFNLLSEYLFALLLLMFLRTNGGGLHFKHYATCFVVSFSVFSGSILLGIRFPFSATASILIVLVSIPLGYWGVPVVSANRPPASQRVVKKSKRNTVVILLAYLLLICIVPMNRYLSIGIWIITIHVVQLMLAKLIKKEG